MASGLAPAEQEQVVIGTAEVLQLFHLRPEGRGDSGKVVAGCRVTDGTMRGPDSDALIRVLRSGDVIFEGRWVVEERWVDYGGRKWEMDCGAQLFGGSGGL